jgi:hypothetical protein
MKRFYFLVLLICLYTVSVAQSEGASKIYGYKQKVQPGTVRVDDNGREVQRKLQYNYFIYLASTSKVTPVEIWLNGEAYAPLVNKVSSPVEYTNPTSGDNKLKVLVPKTNRNVLQLSPSLNKIQKPSAKGKILSAKNELIIIYMGNGKQYYKTVSKLGQFDHLAMQ